MVKFEFVVDDADAELIFDGLRKLQSESREYALTRGSNDNGFPEAHQKFVKHIDGLIPKLKNTKVEPPSTQYDKLSPLDPRD